ncbi:conserved protein of unknown function [Xenorhabdus poinarii G6]|uniref:Uncharacterized protein n=1 Tax=Xenorhabdus poinarii G6 TaxID=1354304 RepID=A0A068R9W2_9GAMM|nr:hypothetical protein [Xenorhabdus poinarii]CDG22995.1 conserved protein of unknown function [Xenorhabdus poinarii G6]
MPDKNNNMDISILTNADLVIGQYVSFVVTLSSDKPILPSKNIIIKSASNNIKLDNISALLKLEINGLKASARLGFTVLQEVSGISVQDGASITFEVDTDATAGGRGFPSKKFSGKAYEIDIASLVLFVKKPYLTTPLTSSHKPSEKDNYTPIYTTLKSKSGKLLAGTPVFITSSILHKMNDFYFKDATNLIDIPPEEMGPNKGILITSDSRGLLKFYLYPKVSEITTLLLKTVILGNVADIVAKQMIYVVNYSNPGYMNSIGTPNIPWFSMGNLYANDGLRYFLTIVNSYDGAVNGDVILFFVNGHYTGHAVTLKDKAKQLDQPSIRLPYSIFERGEPSELSYSVVKENGNALFSEPLSLTYIGGVPYEPDPDVNREYEACIVHTSLGVGHDNIIPSGYGIYVNIDAIIKYPEYQYDGLFVEIVRANTHDPKSKIKSVPLSITDITLNMYINSDNKNFQKTYNQQIPLNKIGSDGNKNSIFFHIPYDDIVDVRGVGNISFDYQFYLNENLEYSVGWRANIETVPEPGYKDNN